MGRGIIYKVLLIMQVLLCITRLSYAQQFNENEVKAAFICNFTKFVEWPKSSFKSDTSAIVIGIYGKDPLAPVVERMAKKINVNGRRIEVKHYENMQQLSFCHLLYISSSEKDHVEQIIGLLKNSSILTISETDEFCRQGGIINFSKKKMKYGFEINDISAKKAGLKISSKLLSLATIVE